VVDASELSPAVATRLGSVLLPGRPARAGSPLRGVRRWHTCGSMEPGFRCCRWRPLGMFARQRVACVVGGSNETGDPNWEGGGLGTRLNSRVPGPSARKMGGEHATFDLFDV